MQTFCLSVLLALVIVSALGHIRPYLSREYPFDLRAFYCGGKIVLHHGDPYTAEPLRSCESAVTTVDPLPSYVVIPVPLPGYDLAFLAPLGALPAYPAKLVFLTLELASLVLIATCLWRLTRLPFAVVLAASYFGVGYHALWLGQLTPFAIAMLALSALALVRERYVLAGIAASLALVQPQLSLGAVLAVLIFVPKARVATCVSCLGLGALSLAVMGFHRTIEYFAALRVHEASEIDADFQLSATWIAHTLGTPDRVALAIGSASFIAMLVTSLYVVHLARRAGDRGSAVVLVPAAFAVLGGSFVHVHQVEVALLAGLVQPHAAMRRTAGLGIALLMVPWRPLSYVPMTLTTLFAILVSMIAVWAVVRYVVTPFAATVSVAVVGAYFVFLRAVRSHEDSSVAVPPPTAIDPSQFSVDPSQFSSVYWHRFVEVVVPHTPEHTAFSLLWKLPLWLGLALIVAAVTLPLLARTERRHAVPSTLESSSPSEAIRQFH